MLSGTLYITTMLHYIFSTTTILNSVRDLNVDYAQGFHLGRPVALKDLIH